MTTAAMDIRALLQKAYGMTEGPLGVPMPDVMAFAVEAALKDMPAECRELVKDGPVRKVTPTPEIRFEEGERADISVITTAVVDRDREVIDPRGVDVKQFSKTGMPVPWAHDYTALPVGRGLWVMFDKAKNLLRAKTIYHTRPDDWQGDWFADAVWHLIKNDGLRGKSIGFLPLQIHAPTPDDVRTRPELADATLIYDKTMMLEYSVAPIPANPDALVQAAAKTKSAGVMVPRSIFEDCGITLPEPMLAQDVEADAFAQTHNEMSDDAGPAAQPSPVLMRAEVRQALETKTKELISRMPTLLADVIARKRGRV